MDERLAELGRRIVQAGELAVALHLEAATTVLRGDKHPAAARVLNHLGDMTEGREPSRQFIGRPTR